MKCTDAHMCPHCEEIAELREELDDDRLVRQEVIDVEVIG
jgi:hypothetical protein